MEENKIGLDKKIAIVLFIIGICAVYLLVVNHGEGDPFFVFTEVTINDTINSSVIHLEDKDIMNVQGLDVRQENGKIIRIYFRYSDTTPAISSQEFYQKYGSHPNNLSLRKYLEYNGVYYYTEKVIP